MHEARPQVIAEVRAQHILAQVMDVRRVFNGEDHLDAAVEVAIHQVGGTEINFFFAIILKIVDAAVFEIAPDGAGTRYTARARHWTDEAVARHREMGFEGGWSAVADQLAALSEGT